MQNVMTGRLFSTRAGTLAAGGAAALLAGILLIAYLHAYRNSVDSGARPATVLVAKRLIPKGTPGTLVAQQALYQVTSVRRDQLKAAAVADPAALAGRTAVADVYPGQQLTALDFSTAITNAISSRISGDERAIAVPVDQIHGMVGAIGAGDRVDVYVGFNAQQGSPVLKLLRANVTVLSAPVATGGGTIGETGSGGAAVLEIPARLVAEFAFAADNARLWLIIRPQAGAKPTPPSAATISSLLAGAQPLGGK